MATKQRGSAYPHDGVSPLGNLGTGCDVGALPRRDRDRVWVHAGRDASDDLAGKRPASIGHRDAMSTGLVDSQTGTIYLCSVRMKLCEASPESSGKAHIESSFSLPFESGSSGLSPMEPQWGNLPVL